MNSDSLTAFFKAANNKISNDSLSEEEKHAFQVVVSCLMKTYPESVCFFYYITL